MIAVDTNLVVRLLANDDRHQVRKASEVFAANEVLLSKTVLLETEWVLAALDNIGLDYEHLASWRQAARYVLRYLDEGPEAADREAVLVFDLKGHTQCVWAVAYSPDGRRLISAGGPWRSMLTKDDGKAGAGTIGEGLEWRHLHSVTPACRRHPHLSSRC